MATAMAAAQANTKTVLLVSRTVLVAGALLLLALPIAGQPAARPSRARAALTTAIEKHRQGDYEQAATSFQQAQAAYNDLSSAERQELASEQQRNTAALQARRDGADQVARADEAIRQGRLQDGTDLLKKVAANQYLTPADKLKAAQLSEQVRLRAPAPSGPALNPSREDLALARTKLQQARALLKEGNVEAAEALAREAERLDVAYTAGEDTPKRFFEDSLRARTDPRALLTAARAALQKGDLDRAEQLARASASHESSWTVHIWSDSPGQVLKDVQAARTRKGERPAEPPAPTATAAKEPTKEPAAPAPQQSTGVFSSIRGMFSTSNKPDPSKPDPSAPARPDVQPDRSPRPTTPAVAESRPGEPARPPITPVAARAPQAPAPPTPQQVATEEARQLLQQAKQALQAGDYAQALNLVGRARAKRPALEWWEDTPEKVEAEIRRVQASRPGPTAGAAPRAADTPRAPESPRVAETPRPAEPPLSKDPKVLLAQGRQALAAGKVDEAVQLAQRAKLMAAGTSTGGLWGLFEDSPDKLLQDVERVRSQRDQQESVRVLVDARKKLDAGDYKGAEIDAYRALKLHGPYSMWDLGDRPQKVLDDVRVAREKGRKPELPTPPPPAAGVAQGPRTPAVPPSPQQTAARDPRTPATPNTVPGPQTVQASRTPAPAAPAPSAAKQQAQFLLAQARQFEKAGRLIEARQKALEAQAVRASFGPGEDSPEQALIQFASAGYKQIETLKQQAAENRDPAAATTALMYARQLAVAFALDVQPIDARLAQLRQAAEPGRALASAPPPVPAPTPAAPVASAAPVVQGSPVAPAALSENFEVASRYLRQGRMELQRGDTASARRLTELAYRSTGPVQSAAAVNIRSDAERLLRSIDAEEFGQKKLNAQKAFDAGMAAYRRRDFSQASAIFRSVDLRMLDQDRQTRLKEISLTPEMQPSRTYADARGTTATDAGQPQAPAGVVPVAPAPAGGQPVPSGATQVAAAGTARATDRPTTLTPEQELLKQTQAMQDIKFQQLRQQGLDAQRDAAERMRTGDTDQALSILQGHLATLEDISLDNDRVALLRRPIDAKLLQFKTLKAQRDFEKSVNTQRVSAKGGRDRIALAEDNKNKKVAELMGQHNSLYKEGKYKEAEMYAMAAHDLDPDNAAAAAAVKLSRIQRNQLEYQKLKDKKEEMFRRGLNEAEDEGEYVDSSDPIRFDPDLTRRNAKDRKAVAGMTTIQKKGEIEKQIELKMSAPVNLNFTDAPLQQVIEDLRSLHGLNIWVDTVALEAENISLKKPVSIKLEGVSLKSALNLLLHQVHLTYVVKEEVVQITSEREAKGKLVTSTFQVADLVIPVENYTVPNSANLLKALDRANHAGDKTPLSPAASPVVGPDALQGGQQVSLSSQGSNGSSMGGTPTTGAVRVEKGGAGSTSEQLLMKLITNTIAPHTWSDMGGPGTIDYFPLAMALVINQTPDVQEQIQQLLDALRRLQELEVAVEVRFITLAEGFYERIGMDFNINIKTDRETAKFEPQITSQQFKPFNYINDFSPDRFITGLTPAGTFTSDLDIPITTSSFAQAIPPFGAFPNIPGGNGGIEMGLAFLSDIQVFLFMEAAQGDQRTNVMQAPKLTLFNGQTSTIIVQDQQFFVTNVQVLQAGGQFAFIPQNVPFPIGISLQIQAVVSADRRFVRLSLQPSLTNIASAVVPLFPIVTPIIPIFQGGFVAQQPVLFTQFIQQPVISTVNVFTTVTVPDGGTVLLGGLKRLSEGRNEFGPPILSKIPYINRLFKNVGFGRETTSLMMMVTPRIIINEEEEFRQTGVGTPPGGLVTP